MIGTYFLKKIQVLRKLHITEYMRGYFKKYTEETNLSIKSTYLVFLHN